MNAMKSRRPSDTARAPRPRGAGLALLGALAGCAAVSEVSEVDAAPAAGERERRQFDSELVEGVPMYTVLPPDAIPAIDDPVLVPASEAEGSMRPDEPVLGVVGRADTPVCYSAWQLDSHEIVNDVVDGEPIAATW